MTNFFEQALGDVGKLEEDLLGPDYSYYSQIKSPGQMGMGSKGDTKTLEKDIAGLIGYVDLLVAGGGEASKVKGPLGDKFFLKTGAKCKDTKTSNKVTRSVYINNIPDGSIPFISSGLGAGDFTEFEGLVPGIMSNLSVINPMQIFQAFMSGSTPDCQALEMETRDVNNNVSTETAFVTVTDINAMNPCWFRNKKNPVTKAKCSESFSTLQGSKVDYSKMPDDFLVKVYYSSLGLLGLYILMKMFEKKK
jgi:hypothetical protein